MENDAFAIGNRVDKNVLWNRPRPKTVDKRP